MTEISLEDFRRLELKVAKILDVQEVPGADRIWRLVIDVGSEKKEVVAGVKAMYPRESLLGKSVIVVNNLAPATIRGVESRGMILAAKNGPELTLLALDKELPPGSIVS